MIQDRRAGWPFPRPQDKGEACHLRPGLALPGVELLATNGETVSLKTLTGHHAVFVYPWMGRPGGDNPPGWDEIPGAHGSTPQAEGYAALFERFKEAGIGVLGLSMQAPEEQAECAVRLALPFPLLHDPNGRFAGALSLPTFKDRDGKLYLARLTLLLEHGVLQRAVYPVHPPPDDAAQILASWQSRSM